MTERIRKGKNIKGNILKDSGAGETAMEKLLVSESICVLMIL